MKYATDMVSGAMIYIPHFIRIGYAIQKLICGDSQRHRQHGDCKRLLMVYGIYAEIHLRLV
jgi:hypothetical protein